MVLKSFVLVGIVLSHDNFLATIEFNLNPATNGGPSVAILPVTAIPCEVAVGRKIYIVKNKSQDTPTISCNEALP